MLGVAGIYVFIVHIAFGPFIAEQIGWPNSPFQNEVAYANLTIGILGLTSFWYRHRDYLLAAMVAFGSWFFADGVGHVVRCWWTTTTHHPMPVQCFTSTC